jgi:2-amino-4-hydroxy-6-hydroxymethyldihydropteridine diphosphokinase
VQVLLSIGSNIGERIENCRRAIDALAAVDDVTLLKESSFYETTPWGTPDCKVEQADFINCAVLIETTLAPLILLEKLKEIELNIGIRAHEEKWGPRIIDLDIVICGDVVMESEVLTVPHRYAAQRAFVMIPAAEIAPDMTHPVLKKSVRDIAGVVPRASEVRRVENV